MNTRYYLPEACPVTSSSEFEAIILDFINNAILESDTFIYLGSGDILGVMNFSKTLSTNIQ